MNILVINSGSSSLKFQLLNMEKTEVLIEGIVERIAIDGSFIKYETENGKNKIETEIPNHTVGLEKVLDAILNVEKVITDKSEIDAIGHRIVHGGSYFTHPVIVTDDVIAKIEDCIDLAPLHNPAHLSGIYGCKEIFTDVPQVVCFDTAFHQTMPAEKFMYAIPKEYYEKYAIRKYGFHGISHEFVSKRAVEILGSEKGEKIITCHIWNGASIGAVLNGEIINTSMGFTPLDGLVMGSRSGNIDASAVTYIMDKEGFSPKEMSELLNKKSGVLGVSGKSSDMRDIEDGFIAGDEDYTLAMNMYVSRIIQTIGQYVADLNGVNTIVFTAGVLENSSVIRELIVKRLGFLGIELKEDANDFRGEERVISTDDSKVTVIVIPTNEEKMIAEATQELVK